MKFVNHLLSLQTVKVFFLFLVVTSCSRNTDQVWDDTKSCGRHISRGIKALAGRQVSSRQVHNKEEFYCWDEPVLINGGYQECEFIPLSNNDCSEIAMAEIVSQQPKETPGDYNSTIPGIDSFRDPATMGSLKNIFLNVQFDYNSNLVKGQKNLEIIQAVADYMYSHPNVYIFAEGHCDKRGAEAYNLALGARRGNAVRNALIQAGVNGDHIFTISYGVERPLRLEETEEAYAVNRRVEFKVYQR